MQISDSVAVVTDVKSGKAKNGNIWAQFSVVSNFWANGKVQRTFKNVKCWDDRAVFAQKLKKGSRIKIMGLLIEEEYEGKKYEYILASMLQYDQNSSKPSENNDRSTPPQQTSTDESVEVSQNSEEDDDDIPF